MWERLWNHDGQEDLGPTRVRSNVIIGFVRLQYRRMEPTSTIDHIETDNIGEDDMDGSTATAIDATKTVANLTKTTGELTSFSQDNIAAFLQSPQVWVAGCQDISKAVASAAQAHLDRTTSAWKALISAKSLREAMDCGPASGTCPLRRPFPRQANSPMRR
jgi:hypothetical protein